MPSLLSDTSFFPVGIPRRFSHQLGYHSPSRTGAVGFTIAFHKNRSWVGIWQGEIPNVFGGDTVSKIERPEKIKGPGRPVGFRGDYTMCSSWGDFKKRYKDPY